MKKTILALTAATVAAVSTPAMAGSVTGEVRLGDLRSAKAASTEYRIESWDSVRGFNLGAEVQVKQPNGQGAVSAIVSGKAGVTLPEVAGIHAVAYTELGESLSQKVTTRVGTRNVVTGGNKTFWGAAVKAERALVGPVSVVVGYRHREGFDGSSAINENRLLGGLNVALNDATTAGATFYRTRGTVDSEVVGLGLTRKF